MKSREIKPKTQTTVPPVDKCIRFLYSNLKEMNTYATKTA